MTARELWALAQGELADAESVAEALAAVAPDPPHSDSVQWWLMDLAKPRARRRARTLSCSACGWTIGRTLPHYYNPVADFHHCTTCHGLGHDWHRRGDSETWHPDMTYHDPNDEE